MVLDFLLDPVLGPLLSLPPFWAIFTMAFAITLLITLVYKYATDQARMKELKAQVKKHQERMKKHKDDPEKMMKVQQEAMSVNMELMKHSFKPTLYTMLPLLLIFGWMSAHFAYAPLLPGEEFTLTAHAEGLEEANLTIIPDGLEITERTRPFVEGEAVWTLGGDAGEYKATIDAGGESVEKRILVDEERYLEPSRAYDGAISDVALSNEEVKPLGALSLLGWRPGWLGTYILLSIALSILLRKALRVV